MEDNQLLRPAIGLFLTTLTTLLLELLLTRVFDVILNENMSYMIITCVIFSFGLSGIYLAIKSSTKIKDIRKQLSLLSLLAGIFIFAILPIMNFLPFDYEKILENPLLQIVSFFAMYVSLIIPFFFLGLIVVILFSEFAGKIQALYFYDLAGAAIGCIIIVPLIPSVGPGGLVFFASAVSLLASGIFSKNKVWSTASIIISCIVFLIPIFHLPQYYDFREHTDKREVVEDKSSNKLEFERWDPISKIDVIDWDSEGPITREIIPHALKRIAYDGGSQSSHIVAFNGNLQNLRENISDRVRRQFFTRAILASHFLKRDSKQDVLIIGSAGGREIKASLMYGARHVDAVEMVGTVVKLGKELYAKYNGNIYNHPAVDARVGEGRSFLRSTEKKYDIIQIYSNHTSSSIASGTGAMATTYLQTAEAYKEYFSHLKFDGVLQINHHIFPKMITTAALAWKMIGLTDFKKHVIVFDEAQGQDDLPTLLIKKSEWTQNEVDELKNFFYTKKLKDDKKFELVENPLSYESSFLCQEFYSGDFPNSLARRIPFRVIPSTDNRPYFNFLRKYIKKLQGAKENQIDRSTALLLNLQLKKSLVPMDIIHLIVTGFVSLLSTIIFIFAPIFFSNTGKSKWSPKVTTLIYFSCLGMGFIILELVFIQLFMKIIGSPLYTYSTVLFTILISAGIGSFSSKLLNINLNRRWAWPFFGIIIYGTILLATNNVIFNFFMMSSLAIRILISFLLIFPLGFCLGMPFPLGILSLEKQPNGAIAWAWGLNGFFTVFGGFLSVIISIYIGFRIAIIIALSIYAISLLAFKRIAYLRVHEI
jgi:spermidine synthase